MISNRITLLFLVVMVFFGLPAYAQQQVMVTPDSYLEDRHGTKITYDEFVAMMNTGEFTPLPLTNEDGEQIGFRLSPRDSASSKESTLSGMKKIELESTKIEEKEVLQFIYRDYLFAPVEFFNEDSRITKWMVFDTGTFIPVVLLPEVAAEIGTVQKIKVGGIEVFGPPMGSYEFNDLLRNLNRYRDRYPEEFGNHEIAGIMGLPILYNYLTSIHTLTGKIILRPMDSDQRTLHSVPTITQVRYKFELGNIWIPVTINGHDGFAHLDTGNPYFDVSANVISEENDPIESFIIGETDLSEYFSGIEFRQSNNLHSRYEGTQIEVISAFGNQSAKPFIITIDPLNKKIYFEDVMD